MATKKTTGNLFKTENILRAMKGIVIEKRAPLKTIWDHATVIRVIKTMPKNSNQMRYAYLVYTKFDTVFPILAIDSYYIDVKELKSKLPKRISCIHDLGMLSQNDFEAYIDIASYSNKQVKENPEMNDVSFYGFHYEK